MTERRPVVRQLRRQLTMDLPTEVQVLEAARLRVSYPRAFADAFAVATAIAHRATLLTGDPEILHGDPNWSTADLSRCVGFPPIGDTQNRPLWALLP